MNDSLDYSSIKNTVWRILSGTPIQIVDDETYSVLESALWELHSPRDSSQGEYSGTRIIGSANIVFAYSIVRIKTVQHAMDSNTDIDLASFETFKTILELLQQDNLVRKNPIKVRKTFKVV
jgi:hypothetical protein